MFLDHFAIPMERFKTSYRHEQLCRNEICAIRLNLNDVALDDCHLVLLPTLTGLNKPTSSSLENIIRPGFP